MKPETAYDADRSSVAVTTAWSPASTSPARACERSSSNAGHSSEAPATPRSSRPGFRASTGAYVLSMLRESIWRDMRLVQRGIIVDAAGPTLNLYPDGASYYLGDDMADERRGDPSASRRRDARRACRGSRKTSPARAGGAPLVRLDGARPARAVAQRPRRPGGGVASALRHRRSGSRPGLPVLDVRDQFLAERFETEHVKAALGWHAINDSVAGPSTPGTAYVLLHDHASEETGGGVRAVGVRPWRDGPAHGDDGRRGARGRRRDSLRRRGGAHRDRGRPSHGRARWRPVRRSRRRGCCRTPTRSGRSWDCASGRSPRRVPLGGSGRTDAWARA